MQKNPTKEALKLEKQINPITSECDALFMFVTVELVLMKAKFMLSLKGLLHFFVFCVPSLRLNSDSDRL